MNSVKYLSIYEELKKRIIEKKYDEGTLFPPEPELQKEFGASRITVRRSVQMLVDEGFLQRMPGIGTVVISNKGALQLNTLTSFAKDNRNKKITSKIVDYQIGGTPKPVGMYQLQLRVDDKGAYQSRIRYIDGKAIGFQRVYIPETIEITDEILRDSKLSIYEYFQEKGHTVTSAQEIIEAVNSDEILSDYLGIDIGSPMLYVKRVTKDQNDKIIEYAEIYYRGDQYHYKLQLKSS